FDDMHMVYAGAGAAIAALVCLAVTVSMLRFAMLIARPDSLPAIAHLVGPPGADLRGLPPVDLSTPVPISARILMPRALDAFPITLKGDGAFALAAVVTREGYVANPELLHSAAWHPQKDQAVDEALGSMMGAMSRAR